MSRHNDIILYGKMHKDPLIRLTDDGDFVMARFSLDTIIGDRDMQSYVDKLRYQQPWILARDSEIIEKISDYHKNDMIYLKGVLTTQEIIKRPTCPNCQSPIPIDKANATYITPIFIKRMEQNVTDAQALELLKDSCEISNQAMIVGTLCRDPQSFTSKKGKTTTNYQLAVNRKYFIKDGDPMVKTDYPWVRSYDKIAKNDAEALSTNSEVLIDGFINSRIPTRKLTCEACGHSFDWNDLPVLEIIPYSVEYLKNCKSLEEIDKEKDELAENLVDQILKE